MLVLQYIKKVINLIFKLFFRVFSCFIITEDKTVIFMAFHGRGFLDNPKALYEEMLKQRRFERYNFIWVLNRKEQLPVKTVRYQSIAYFYYMARAKYWIVNCKLPEYMYKKSNQIYVQTWHGTPLKKLGRDISVGADTFSRSGLNYAQMCNSYLCDAKKYDYMISPNSFSTEVFQSAFGVERSQIIETGYPRNDILEKANEDYVKNLKKKYGIPEGKKVILYAPTWRDDMFNVSGYTLDLHVNFKRWKETLCNYCVLFKAHYLIADSLRIPEDMREVFIATDVNCDINELYLISDCLITDYSSVFFDYSLLRRPIYFYMYDYEKYKDKLRGFYLDVNKELPGKVYKDEVEMLEDIKSGIYDFELLRRFNERFNDWQTGDCSEKVLSFVFGKEENEI